MVGGSRGRKITMTALHEARLQPDVYDDDDILLPLLEHAPHAALRLPDGRAMAWAEYGSSRGLPCVLVPDTGSSRLAPDWLLHDSALPAAIRLLAIGRESAPPTRSASAAPSSPPKTCGGWSRRWPSAGSR